MTEVELRALLETLGIPVKYRRYRFDDLMNDPTPPPYIVYFFTFDNNFKADNYDYVKKDNFDIELYTDKKDPALEDTLDSLLNSNELIDRKSKTENWIASEDMCQIVYEVEIIGG